MKQFARFVTLAPEERARLGLAEPGAVACPRQQRPGSAARLKSHRFAVTYPDGSEGECHYSRLGLRDHRFRFFDRDNREMPRQFVGRPLVGGAPLVEETGKVLAAAAFGEAVERERRDFFARACVPADGSRTADPARYQMSASRAKQQGGKYALCLRIGTRRLLRVSRLYDRLDEANAAWRDQPGSRQLVVACCNRLDRRWELPRYNPLYAEFDSRRQHSDRDGGGDEPEETAAP